MSNNSLTRDHLSPYSINELEYFREIILKKRDEAKHELETLHAVIRENMQNSFEKTAYASHLADASLDVQEHEKIYLSQNRMLKFLRHLDKALDRIDNRTYGICKVTGHKIAKGRLEAVPHTQLSIQAKLQRR